MNKVLVCQKLSFGLRRPEKDMLSEEVVISSTEASSHLLQKQLRYRDEVRASTLIVN